MLPPPALPPISDVTLSALCGPWKIHQRTLGHRWSVDDLLTAHLACMAAPQAGTHLDLGCGIGSVLMLVAYKLKHSKHLGVEAQAQSAALCAASLEHNGLQGRVSVRRGDFREPGTIPPNARFELITGTPPYLPLGTATPPRDAQKAGARLELRGGVEAYCLTAATHLAPGGTVVLCGNGRTPQRTRQAAQDAGLHVHAWLDFIPLLGKPCLLHVVTLKASPATQPAQDSLTARNPGKQRTAAMQAVRTFFDMPHALDDEPQ